MGWVCETKVLGQNEMYLFFFSLAGNSLSLLVSNPQRSWSLRTPTHCTAPPLRSRPDPLPPQSPTPSPCQSHAEDREEVERKACEPGGKGGEGLVKKKKKKEMAPSEKYVAVPPRRGPNLC